MNKLSLYSRIAEIEKIGFLVLTATDDPFVLSFANQKKFDPVMDDALCHRLMIKHDIVLKKIQDGDLGYSATFVNLALNEVGVVYSHNPNEAICLAIEKKHEKRAL